MLKIAYKTITIKRSNKMFYKPLPLASIQTMYTIDKPLQVLYNIQYFGQFLKRDAMPSASNAYAIPQRSENSECNLNPK